MKPHTALLCDAHVWALAECPICALEREITKRERAAKRIEELQADLAIKNALIDRAIACWDDVVLNDKPTEDMDDIVEDMRDARGGK